MKKRVALLVCFSLSIASVHADTALPAGRPAGVKDAQAAGNLFYIYGGVVLYGALLFLAVGRKDDAPVATGTSS